MKRVFSYVVLTSLGLCGCDAVDTEIATQRPTQIASTSLCGDSYLQAFAPQHIAALSWQSRSDLSLATPEQKELPKIDSAPERILSQKDKLVLFGPGEGHELAATLPYSVTLKWAEDFDGVAKNAKLILDTSNLPLDMLLDWEAGVETTRLKGLAISKTRSPKILYLTPSGGSAGQDTFVDAAIGTAGGTNINQTSGWHSPNVETLIHYNPDIIIMSFTDTNYHSRSQIMSPVIERFLKDKTVITIDGSYWPCAGPYLLDATKIIQGGILDWQAGQDV